MTRPLFQARNSYTLLKKLFRKISFKKRCLGFYPQAGFYKNGLYFIVKLQSFLGGFAMEYKKFTICGKGGSGKSTVTALMAKQLAASGRRVLVIDCDESNYGLHQQLGMELY